MAIPIYVTSDDLIPEFDSEPAELVALLAGLAAAHDDDPIERIDFMVQFADQAKAQSSDRMLIAFLSELLLQIKSVGV